MSSQITGLEKELCFIKKRLLCTTFLKCDECNYNASSETVLKRQITTKHKHTLKTPDKSKDINLNASLKLAEPSEE